MISNSLLCTASPYLYGSTLPSSQPTIRPPRPPVEHHVSDWALLQRFLPLPSPLWQPRRCHIGLSGDMPLLYCNRQSGPRRRRCYHAATRGRPVCLVLRSRRCRGRTLCTLDIGGWGTFASDGISDLAVRDRVQPGGELVGVRRVRIPEYGAEDSVLRGE